MDLRTFRPPPPLPVAAPAEVGGPAPSWPRPRQGASIIAFLRHVGCPFAEATLRRMREGASLHPDLEWWVVSHGPPDATEGWCQAFGGVGGVRVLSDCDRTLYAAWGLPRSSVAHFLGWRSLTGVLRLALRGIRNRHPSGTRWQTAGNFAVDDSNIVRWRHLPAHAGDLPDLEAAAAILHGKRA